MSTTSVWTNTREARRGKVSTHSSLLSKTLSLSSCDRFSRSEKKRKGTTILIRSSSTPRNPSAAVSLWKLRSFWPKSFPRNSDSSTPAADSTSHPVEMDWRAFRAQLVQSEKPGNKSIGAEGSMKPAAKRWAHPILAPEAGCVLIATEKLDGQQNFERTVILLLSPGSNNPREGPYGLILNRPLLQRIKDIKPKDRAWVKHFGNCQAHLGGPMDTEVFLLLHGTSGIQGYQEVIPGVYCGTSEGLEPVAEFAKRGNRSLPQGFRFFFGYSGWGTDQLKKEIAAGLWCVAACSSDLITSTSTSGLWEGVLQLMGGKYLELSKRPRRKQY
ncbi:unnamed protein product [Sphagnum jensenii]|uniref:Uncharacterized protein n=1 Tax=Sphagnum jensenii TaxID=128206 RepID=A0ABP0XMR2_9BRYO